MLVYDSPQGGQIVSVDGTGWAILTGEAVGMGGGWQSMAAVEI
jgi:hypothetical protein